MTAIDKPSELNLLIIRFPRGSESEYTANFSPKSNQKIFIHGVIDVNKVAVMRWILRLEHQRVKNKGGPGGINARIKLQRVGVQNKASGRYILKITFLLTTVVYLLRELHSVSFSLYQWEP